ncbi:NAD(P)-dependent alcohol dehydrogenase [Spelaeicoccus albus]|uniref:NADPH:quinone reductase-like Zn-dependent oxidoreductase n=2 Tax=Spelaeicoccus albus TaxID=1280376 RepID=A0A7Z0D176_9MICO|nr:NADPH:quinone reductase-like Zn-dependent oxidoreductase [Spelaeicoccus albus]
MTTMRVAQLHGYGPPDMIKIGTAPVPRPKAGQVLVRVRATTVNGGEVWMRAGRLRLMSGSRFPKGLGIDVAGEVAELGDGVTDMTVGERVWGSLDSKKMVLSQAAAGATAEYVAVDAARLAPMPDGATFDGAAALLVGITAFTALRDKARVRPGERLLVRGGTGGVGYVGVELGRAFGARVTTLVSAANLEVAGELGADVALDYRSIGPDDLGRFDVIFDTVGTRMNDYRRLLAPGGRMVSIMVNPPLRGFAAVLASVIHGGRRIRAFSGNPTRALLIDYARYIESGQLRPLIADTYRLEQTAAAHEAIESGGRPGKHVILP